MKNKKRISVIVGNGFDLSMLRKMHSERNTSYDMFYHYYMYKKNGKNTNLIIYEMEECKKKKLRNWSDIENALNNKILEFDDDKRKLSRLNIDLKDIQKEFSLYLNEIINGNMITHFSKKCENTNKTLKTFTDFLEDLDEEQYKKIRFKEDIDNHFDIIFDFYNLNYTALLDNYVFLSNNKFDPKKYNTSSNNITMNLNPNGYEGKYIHSDPYVNLITNVYHPHGIQDVPASLLFGTEAHNIKKEKIGAHDPEKQFVKSLWARCDERYGGNLNDTDLFIIFGSSLGKTDSWWWQKITKKLNRRSAELIIYNYCKNEKHDDALRRFSENLINIKLKEESRVFVINYKDKSNINFLQL